MLIDEAQAVAAARAYADDKSRPRWQEGSVRTVRVTVSGQDCWRVTADDAVRPGDSWLDVELFDGGQSYLIDAATGECVGIGLLNGYRLFKA